MPSSEELTEDGYPIGEVVVSNAVAPKARLDAETREDKLRAELSEMTGGGDADAALAELYDGYLDKEKRAKALRLYLVERKSLREVAEAVGVPPRTVSMWSYNGRWDVALRREIQVEQEHSMLQLVRLRTNRRYDAASEQLEAAKTVREKTLAKLAENEVSVKSAAEALKSAADVEARILGISESGSLDRGEKAEGEKQSGGKQPLVAIIQGGGLPPIKVAGGAQ